MSTRRSSMSSSRDSSCSRDESNVKRRSMGTRRETKSKEVEEDKESKDNRAIRTRLSTGSIHMNGTTTIAVAKEIENNSKLLTKDSPSGVRKKKLSAVDTQSVGTPPPKKRKIGRNDGTGEDNRNDYFCWLCHKEGTVVCCEVCPRVYHTKCLELDTDLPKEWVCPECEKIMRAECVDTRSTAMSIISVDTLCSLLGFALERMKHQGTEPFMKPVDQASVLHYSDYIFNPMDLTMLEKNIKKKMYGCTEAFLADAKWILHNCIIFNGTHHKLTASAKMIIKICKHEMAEIELCPDCYWNSCVRKNDEWFTELCRSPHRLVWAKLKGYPFWPAKVLREIDGQVDVRFFGAHDRSLLPTSQVFLLSKNIPTPAKNKKGGFDYSMEELNLHIKKLEQKFGTYEYAQFRCPYDNKNVYKEGKFKVSPKRRLGRSSTLKFGQANVRSNFKDTLMKQRQRANLNTDSKAVDKQTILSKTASAVRNKYNSIITTRRNSSMSSSLESSPVKGDSKNVLVDKSNSPSEILSSPVDAKSASEILSKLKTRLQGKIIETNDSKSEVKTVMTSSVSQTDTVVDTDALKGDNINNSVTEDKSGKIYTSENAVKTINKSEKRTSMLATIESKLKILSDEETNSVDSKEILQETPSKVKSQKVEEQKILTSPKICEKNSDIDTEKETDDSEKKEIKGGIAEKLDILTQSKKEKSDILTPSKKDYLSKLQETIKKGKENLGLTDETDEIDDETTSSEEEEDEDDEDEVEEGGTDDDEMEEDDGDGEGEDAEMNGQKKDSENVQVSSSGSSDKESAHEKLPVALGEVKDANMDKKTLSDESVQNTVLKSKTVIEREYETVLTDVLDETTGQITRVKEKKIPEPMETQEDDTCLMMEVETESDTDKLVIDTDDDKTLSPSPHKSKVIVPSCIKIAKPLTKKPNAVKTPPKISSTTECAPSSPPLVNRSLPLRKDTDKIPSQTELRSDFFQSAVEKTLKQKPLNDFSSTSTYTGKKSPEQEKVKSLTSIKPSATTSVKMNSAGNIVVTSTTSIGVNSSVVTSVNSNSSSSVNSSINMNMSSDVSSNKTVKSPLKTDESRSSIIANFTQKIMGPIQTAFTEFFSEVLEQEREKITQELMKTKEQLIEEKKMEKTPEEQSEAEKKHWEYSQQFSELKYNFRLTCLEMKSSWESEKGRLVDEIKEMMKKEKEAAINETKKKQWCAKCGKEAIFYCCWNTSYCDYPCQQAHWPTHMATCMQQTNENDPNKNQSAANQNNPPSNQNVHNNRPNVPQPPNKSPMELEQEEFQRRHRAEEQQHQQFNLQPNGGYMPMHTSPPGVMHNMHRQQESPPNQRKKTSMWSDQDMNNAVVAVNYGGMSINKASKVYNVPRSKITERVSKQGVPMNPQMMPGNQPPNPQLQLQYVQPPQPMSMPPSIQSFSSPPQMRMPTNQPILTGMINQPGAPQNNSILFPIQLRPTQPSMNIPPGMMPPAGQLMISQGGQPPRQSPNMMPRSMPFHGRF